MVFRSIHPRKRNGGRTARGQSLIKCRGRRRVMRRVISRYRRGVRAWSTRRTMIKLGSQPRQNPRKPSACPGGAQQIRICAQNRRTASVTVGSFTRVLRRVGPPHGGAYGG